MLRLATTTPKSASNSRLITAKTVSNRLSQLYLTLQVSNRGPGSQLRTLRHGLIDPERDALVTLLRRTPKTAGAKKQRNAKKNEKVEHKGVSFALSLCMALRTSALLRLCVIISTSAYYTLGKTSILILLQAQCTSNREVFPKNFSFFPQQT